MPEDHNTAEDQSDDTHAICPYCEDECFQPESEDYSEDERVEECGNCGKSFYLSQCFTVSHDTRGDCTINGEEHDYQPVSLPSGKSAPFCTKCDKCQPHNER